MVQILPRPYASSGERLEEGFSRGLQQGAGFAQNILGHKLEEKAKIADIERKQKFAEQIYNNPDLQGLPEITRRLLANEAAGLQSAQATKSTLNLLREQEGRSRLADALGILQEEGAPNEEVSAPRQPPITDKEPKTSSRRNYEAEKRKWSLLLADPDPINRDFAKRQIDEINRQEEMQFKKGQAEEKKSFNLRNETLPIRKEIAEKANAALQGIQNKKQLLDVVRSGNIDDPTYSIIAQALPLRLGERMLSPESVQYRGAIIDEFKDLRTVFQGQTRIKEIDLLEDKIAGLYLTDEQKEALLTSRINALQADVIKGEVAAQLEEEGDFGGALQFQKKVNERSQARLKDLFNLVLDEQKSIIQNAENKKKVPLNANDPDDLEIIDQILEEAGGNWREAEKLAKKRGYKFNA